MGVIKLLPKLTTAVPAPLAAIVTVTGLSQVLGLATRTVGRGLHSSTSHLNL